MTAFTYRMPAGIPGTVSRWENATVETQIVLTAGAPTTYGVPVAVDAATGNVRGITTGDAAAALYGILVRPFPTTGNGTDGLGVSTPPTSGLVNVAKRGYIQVLLGGATAAVKNGIVYVRVAAAAGGKPIGGIEAAADSSNTIAFPSSTYFMGPADANGMTEIALNI